VLATYANIPRIEKMIENLCMAFGKRIDSYHYSFPTPESIVGDETAVHRCGLGFRCNRFVQFARRVYDGSINFDELREMEYEDCVRTLKKFEGVGDKVADCIALFSLDQLEAFPIDVRIARAVRKHYGVEGNYKKVSKFCRSYFGVYAGYAQEFIYLSEAKSNTGLTFIDERVSQSTRGQMH
jgi:N-glycosylase/DNA lyase